MKQECVLNPSSSTSLRYRAFTAADIPAALGLSMALGWPYRQEDWQFSTEWATGVVVEDRGLVIGTAMCWKFGTEHASIGHVIVSSEYQGRGIGRALMAILFEELGPRITFLHATPEGRPLYEKIGFSVCGWLDQCQGHVTDPVSVVLSNGERLRTATPAELPVLIDLASRASGLERHAILSSLFKLADVVVLERGGEIVGFSALRRFGRGHVIGPVVAPQSREQFQAKALIGYWLTRQQGEFVRVDVPSGTSLTGWLGEQGLKRVDTAPKMVRNASAVVCNAIPDQVCGVYAVVSQALL